MRTLRSHTRRVGRGMVALALLLASVACGHSPTAPTDSCSFALSATSRSFAADGGPGTVSVTTGTACSWSVTGADGWIALTSPASATGPGTVSYTGAANAGDAARDKTITIAALAFIVRQDASSACAFSIDPEQHRVDAKGGARSVSVATAASCGWNAVSNAPWIVVEGTGGRGAGAVSYRVAENNTTSGRTGSLTIATRTHTVEQAGEDPAPADCDYRVGPVEFAPCMASGTLTATISTGPSCAWTAAADDSWLSVVDGRSGTGPGTIRVRYTDNYLAPRHGVVMVRWPTPSLGQNLQVAQAGCRYGVSQSSIDVPAAGTTGTFDVVQESDPNTCGGALQDRCVWTARSDVPWVTIGTPMPRTGDDRVSFTVAANTGSNARTGHVTAGDRTVTFTQPGS